MIGDLGFMIDDYAGGKPKVPAILKSAIINRK
jgi:hypothetical protein